MVTPRGIEPRSMPSESTTLSVELRSHIEKITAAYRKVRSLFSIHGFRRKVNIYMLIVYDFLSGKRDCEKKSVNLINREVAFYGKIKLS